MFETANAAFVNCVFAWVGFCLVCMGNSICELLNFNLNVVFGSLSFCFTCIGVWPAYMSV